MDRHLILTARRQKLKYTHNSIGTHVVFIHFAGFVHVFTHAHANTHLTKQRLFRAKQSMLYAVYIVNKSGGLIFRQDTHSSMPK